MSNPEQSTPLYIQTTREQLEDAAKLYLKEYFNDEVCDDYYLRLGMMVDFSHFLFNQDRNQI